MASETPPDAPAIPGLTFRRFRGDADYPLMIPVIDASRAADQIHEVETAERLAEGYANTKRFDPTRDVIMAEVDGRLAGYRHAMWWDQLDGVRILHHFGFLRPEWRGQGLERALVHACEARLREIAQADPAPRSEFDTYVADTETALEALLESEGYTATRHFYDMVRPDLANIPDAPLPPGLEVRPAQPEHYRAIWEAETEAFEDHWGEEELEDADFARCSVTLFQPDLWQVAWDGDRWRAWCAASSTRSTTRASASGGLHREHQHAAPLAQARPGRAPDRPQPAPAAGPGHDRVRAGRGHGEPERGAAPLRADGLSGRQAVLDLPQAAGVTH